MKKLECIVPKIMQAVHMYQLITSLGGVRHHRDIVTDECNVCIVHYWLSTACFLHSYIRIHIILLVQLVYWCKQNSCIYNHLSNATKFRIQRNLLTLPCILPKFLQIALKLKPSVVFEETADLTPPSLPTTLLIVCYRARLLIITSLAAQRQANRMCDVVGF